MQFTETKLKGAFIIDLEHRSDNRGFLLVPFAKKSLKPMVYPLKSHNPIFPLMKKREL
jgi:dTDP-4-dehydrorhamnose 3,5-epimerase-like enzyme